MKRIAIIGAGFGGLGAAAILARAGFEVDVYEKNGAPGGRAMLYCDKGFTFDMGPSWYLMPDVFENFFAAFGKKPSDLLKLRRLDPSYRVFFEGEGAADVSPSLEKNCALFDSFEPGGGARLKKYLQEAKSRYALAMGKFVYRDYKSILDFADPRLIFDGIRLGLFGNIDSYVKRSFSSDKARKILEYTMVFLGGSPSSTPGLYSIMSHVDLGMGVYYPEGGIGELALAMERLAKENGARFHYDSPVSSINSRGGLARTLSIGKKNVEADVVVADADYHHVETELLRAPDRTYGQGYWKSRVMAPSAFLVFLGLGKKVKGLAHHNLFLAKNWDRHFSQIFENPKWPDNPSYYVSCPSKTDKTVAPKGKECLFILVPVASGLEDTDSIRAMYLDRVVSHLEEALKESLQDSIEIKRVFSHNDFTSAFNSYKGTALGMSHTLFQTALWRPSHKSGKLKNLYFTGHYTHPGVGVPMTIISSQIISREIADAYGE